MGLLLDTHVMLWSLYEPERIPFPLQATLLDPNSLLYRSDASLWEMLDKAAKGRLPLAGSDPKKIRQRIEQFGLIPVPVTEENIVISVSLPLHHRDPFDRMLVAQAMRHGLKLVTKDETLPLYGVPTLWN